MRALTPAEKASMASRVTGSSRKAATAFSAAQGRPKRRWKRSCRTPTGPMTSEMRPGRVERLEVHLPEPQRRRDVALGEVEIVVVPGEDVGHAAVVPDDPDLLAQARDDERSRASRPSARRSARIR